MIVSGVRLADEYYTLRGELCNNALHGEWAVQIERLNAPEFLCVAGRREDERHREPKPATARPHSTVILTREGPQPTRLGLTFPWGWAYASQMAAKTRNVPSRLFALLIAGAFLVPAIARNVEK